MANSLTLETRSSFSGITKWYPSEIVKRYPVFGHVSPVAIEYPKLTRFSTAWFVKLIKFFMLKFFVG